VSHTTQDGQTNRAMRKPTHFIVRIACLCSKYLTITCKSQHEGKSEKYSSFSHQANVYLFRIRAMDDMTSDKSIDSFQPKAILVYVSTPVY
jgi:hypothetical protein